METENKILQIISSFLSHKISGEKTPEKWEKLI